MLSAQLPSRASPRDQSSPGEPSFRKHLDGATPLDRTSELELLTRLGACSRERATIILGFPRVVEHLHMLTLRQEGRDSVAGATLRANGAAQWISSLIGSVTSDVTSFRERALTLTYLDTRLDEVGQRLLDAPFLADTRLTSPTALSSYRRFLRASRPTEDADLSFVSYREDRLSQVESTLNPLIDTLISRNLRLVYAVARRFNIPPSYHEELIGVGNLALVNAALNFKTSVGVRFSTYAFRCIEHAMVESLHDDRSARTLRPHDCSDEQKSRSIVSLHQPIKSGDECGELIELIADQAAPQPSEQLARIDELTLSSRIIKTLLPRLPTEERTIIETFYGLTGGERRPLTEIATELGKTRDYVHVRLTRGELRLRRLIETESSAALESLGLSTERSLQTPPPTGHTPAYNRTPRSASAAAPLVDSEAHRIHQRALLSPSPELFEAVDRYTAELTRIRRSTADPEPLKPAASAALKQLDLLHESLTHHWPQGHAQKRYGFQLEGEMLRSKALSPCAVQDLTAAMSRLRAELTPLSSQRIFADAPNPSGALRSPIRRE